MDDKGNIAMRKVEWAALSEFLDKKRNIDISMGHKDGDFVRITSGALIGKEWKILKINKSSHEAVVGAQIFGRPTTMSVAIEFFERGNV